MKPTAIDRLLPKMRCDDNCGQCCTIVMCSQSDFDRVREFARVNNIAPIEQGLICPFYQGGRCAVHSARPTVCRLYGHVEKMECPRGYNVNVPITIERKIMSDSLRRGAGVRCLHEFVGTGPDILKVMEAEL